MAWRLFQLGRWSFLHRRLVAGIWVALLLLTGVGAATLSGKTTDSFTLPGLESTKAFALIKERSPQASADGATAQVVFKAPTGEKVTSAANTKAIAAALATARTKDVSAVAAPAAGGSISANGKVGYATISYTKQAVELTATDRHALETAKSDAQHAGLEVAIGGDALQAGPAGNSSEAIGIVIALFVLLITFGSLIAAGMPLLTAILGVGIGITGITTLTGFVQLSSVTPALGSMLGLAVGIDYALFIMSRYQHEVRKGRAPDEAAGVAVGTAGSAVIFAGLTVVIALTGLSVTRIGFLTQMGLGGAATVAIAVLIALTLLPALLGFAGTKVMKARLPFLKDRDTESSETRSNGRRWVDGVVRFRFAALLAGIAVAAVVSLPVLSMELALPDNGTAAKGTDARTAFDLISDNFGKGRTARSPW